MLKIAILGAMREEIEPMLAKVKVIETHKIGGNVYYEAEYHSNRLIIAYSKIGKVNAALSASVMFLHFGCDLLIFSGVAGAISPNIKIGDIVIADKLCQHDVDITAFSHPYGFIPEGETFYASDSRLNTIAQSVAQKQGINYHVGIVATGDQFIASETKKQWIAQEFNAIALEMEGGSVASVCASLQKPFCVLRAISDAADMDASFNFDEFLQHAARRSANLLFLMLDEVADAWKDT